MQNRLPGLGQGLASIGEAIAAWRQEKEQDAQKQGRFNMLDSLLAEDPAAPMGQPDPHAPLRKFIRGLDEKGRSALVASSAFDTILQKALLGGNTGKQVQALAGDTYAQQMGLPDPGRFKDYVVKYDSSTGDANWLYQPKDGTGSDAEAPFMKSIDVGGETVTYQWDKQARQWGEVARAPRWQPKEASDNLGMSQPMALKTKARDPVTGEMVERTSTFEFVPRKGGGGFVRAGPPLMESEERTPLPKAEAGAVQGAREGIRLVKELRSLLFQGPKGDQLNEGALMSKALGLPGAIAPEGASIEPKVLQAVDPYVRATTGAALNQQELENARTMFVPSFGEGKELVRDKLDRLERFLAGDLGLMGMVAVPGSPLSSWVATHPGEGAQVGAGAKAPEISTKEQYDKLKSGDPFVWNGKRGVKP